MKLSHQILTELIQKELKRELIREQDASFPLTSEPEYGFTNDAATEIEKTHPKRFPSEKNGHDVLDLDDVDDFRTAFATARAKPGSTREGGIVYKYFTYGGNTKPWPKNIMSTLQAGETKEDWHLATADRVMPEEDIAGRTGEALNAATAEFEGRDIGAELLRPPGEGAPHAEPSFGAAGEGGRGQFDIGDESLYGAGPDSGEFDIGREERASDLDKLFRDMGEPLGPDQDPADVITDIEDEAGELQNPYEDEDDLLELPDEPPGYESTGYPNARDRRLNRTRGKYRPIPMNEALVSYFTPRKKSKKKKLKLRFRHR